MSSKLKKFLNALGIETEKVEVIVEEVEGMMGEQTPESKAPEKTPESKPKDPDKKLEGKSEIEILKEQHAKDLAKIKQDADVKSYMTEFKVKAGYEDIVRSQLELDDGKTEGLKEKFTQLAKDKPLLFGEAGGQPKGYDPNGGQQLANNPKTISEITKELNAHRIVK